MTMVVTATAVLGMSIIFATSLAAMEDFSAAMLATDDACHSNLGSECGLSLRQLRQSSTRQAEELAAGHGTTGFTYATNYCYSRSDWGRFSLKYLCEDGNFTQLSYRGEGCEGEPTSSLGGKTPWQLEEGLPTWTCKSGEEDCANAWEVNDTSSCVSADHFGKIRSKDEEVELGSAQRKIMTLYHQTSPSIGKLILKGGFLPGHLGWCGGGIYFAMTPAATTGKIKGPDSHHGFMIEAKVDVGRVKHMSWRCTTKPSCNHHPYSACQDKTNRGSWLKNQGYDSIAYTPDRYGQEIVIYDKNKVVSMKGYSYHR